MVDLLTIFAFKLLDTSLGALKNIFMIKNKYFLSATFNALSYIFYILLFKRLMASNDTLSIVVTCASIFLGQYLTQIYSDRFSKDRVWKIEITPRSKEEGKELADRLKEVNIPVKTNSCYANYESEKTKVLDITAYSETKAISAIIKSILDEYEGIKFNVAEIRNSL